MKGFIDKLVKTERRILVDNANLARTATAIYDVCGRRTDTVMIDPQWTVGGQEWLLTFKATGAQVDEIRAKLA